MSFFGTLVRVFSSSLQAVEEDDDVLPSPPGNTFYETMPIPSGPGVAELNGVLSVLPPVDLKHGPWICGGAARRLLQGMSLKDGDVDLFFKNKASWETFVKAMEPFELVIKTERANTYLVNGIKVQLIRRKFHLQLEDVFKDFDFSVCQIATDGHVLAATKQAHLDITDGLIRFAPAGTVAKHTLVQRMVKYVGYGFVPEPGLYELMVKSGLDYVSAYVIFEGNDVAVYDPNDGDMVEDEIPTEALDAGVMRTIARQLGLEVENV